MDLLGEPSWLDRLWETASFYEWFADAYGWSADQVDAQRALFVELFPEIRAVRHEIADDRRRAAEARAKR